MYTEQKYTILSDLGNIAHIGVNEFEKIKNWLPIENYPTK